MTFSAAHPLVLFLLLAAPFVGSFVATFVVRWPQGRPVVLARSTCPSCAAPIRVYDLVPVFAWLLRRGRCRSCGAPIAALYPLSELAALGIALWAVTAFGGVDLALVCILGWALLALALVDLRTMLLPDILTLIVLALGLLAAALEGRLPDALLGAAVGFAAFSIVAFGYRRWRGRDGLGLGDVKLLAAAGAWVGWAGLPGLVFLASIAALTAALLLALRGRRDIGCAEIAFGPYLAVATWITVLYGPLTLA